MQNYNVKDFIIFTVWNLRHAACDMRNVVSRISYFQSFHTFVNLFQHSGLDLMFLYFIFFLHLQTLTGV